MCLPEPDQCVAAFGLLAKPHPQGTARQLDDPSDERRLDLAHEWQPAAQAVVAHHPQTPRVGRGALVHTARR